MAKKIIEVKKTEKEWDRLYNSYLQQHAKLESSLNGNVDQTLTKVEYKGLYTSAINEGLTKNITRSIVQSEAKVSYAQALRRMEVARKMLAEVKIKRQLGVPLSEAEIEIINEFTGKGRITVKRFRTEAQIVKKLDNYIAWLNEGLEEGDDEYSYAEYIDSP